MTRVAVATSSAIAADAANTVAARGGNAVDCALAAAITTMNTEPGVCSLAGGAYVTVWPADGEPVAIDGNHAVPGRGLDVSERDGGKVTVELDYGGGITTIVGAGSVAIPGALAAIERASRRYGNVDWATLFEPVIDITRRGFPLSAACHYYLGYSGKTIYGRSEDGYAALHTRDGRLRDRGSAIVVPHLADSLERIARDGADVFYRGELAERIVQHVRDADGALTADDMAACEAVERPALVAGLGDWRIATNPPPAVGGAVLAAMLLAFSREPVDGWDRDALDRLIRVHRACLDYRRRRLDVAEHVGAEAEVLLMAAADGHLLSEHVSASTVHTSAVDDDGLGCAVTASSGYGAGDMPAGTGLWLNNGLGEIELYRRDPLTQAPGTQLPSNMAPTIARSAVGVMAIGSPGADRITSAIHQVLVNTLQLDMPLDAAVRQPRLHVDMSGDAPRLTAEAAVDLPPTDLPVATFDGLNMYFGGVGAARYSDNRGFEVAADPRREGGTLVTDD
ncbi:MAG: gamma-glutamyltransferase [Pseudomonadota bacterium]